MLRVPALTALGFCLTISACGTVAAGHGATSARASSTPNCSSEIASAPAAPAASPTAITNHRAPDGSWQIQAPANLTSQPIRSNNDGYVLELQEGQGTYPALAVRVFSHPFEMSGSDPSTVPLPFPFPKDLANREAKGFANDKGVTKPVVVSVVQLPAMDDLGAGKLIICLNQSAGYGDPNPIIVQYLIERFADTRDSWNEYVVELTTTRDRYQQDAAMARAAAESFRFTK